MIGDIEEKGKLEAVCVDAFALDLESYSKFDE